MSQARIQLRVEDVEVVYNSAILALRGVSFSVAEGKIVALLGANGAGKSTTLKAVSSLLPAERGRITRGSILYEDRSTAGSSASALVRGGLVQVLEGRHCFRGLSVEEDLVTGAIARGASRAEIRGDLERVYGLFPRLREKRRAAAGLTSGGEQQMTAIGRALMARPRLLVLDEPTMGLAPLVVRDIFRTLKRLNATEGLTILVAEQNSTVALRYADHAYVLENGRVVLGGPAAELRERSDIKAFYLGESASLQAVAPAERTPGIAAA